MMNKYLRFELNQDLLGVVKGDKQSSKDGKDGKEGKDDISAMPDQGSFV